ncbi:MAG: biopolymer transporter ExbD [Prevotella sp.]|jgi:biopolymer transport protein ExbD|nr:biopolymer transporter ExbD [Prevotella sp.]
MAVGKSKQKKMNVRVDFTPMVDMMMLLITFFMLCTSLAKPQTMELSMPSNDKNLTDQDKTVTKESYTITFYCTADNQLYYVAGQVKPEDPKCLKKTTWGAKGIRSVIFNHQTEDGTQPAKTVMEAKARLDKEKDNPNKKMPDSIYNQRLAQIKAGIIDGQKINTLTIIIKATDNSTYKNLVDALDEMQICSIGKYVIDKVNDNDLKLLKENKVKL